VRQGRWAAAINGHGEARVGAVSVRGEVEVARVGSGALKAPFGGEGKGRGKPRRRRGRAARRVHGENGAARG
jgi:hypothetical protein